MLGCQFQSSVKCVFGDRWVVVHNVELDKGCIIFVGFSRERISDGLGVLPLVEFNYCSISGRTQRFGASPSTNNYKQNK